LISANLVHFKAAHPYGLFEITSETLYV